MKTSIKTTVGIIAIALSSISFAQAGEHRGDRGSDRHYDKPRQERNYRKNTRREHSKHMSHSQERFRDQRHFRKHKRYNRHARRHFRAYKRARKHYGWKRGYRRGYYNYTGYGYDSYVSPRYYVSPRHSSHVSVSGDEIPVLAGTLIGSAIASDASDGNPVATFGGAVIGAIIGNQIAHH